MSIHEAFPYLRIVDAARAIDFYRAAFGATERLRLVEPSGRVGHAELAIGPLVLMLSEAYPEYGLHAPDGAHTLHCAVQRAGGVRFVGSLAVRVHIGALHSYDCVTYATVG